MALADILGQFLVANQPTVLPGQQLGLAGLLPKKRLDPTQGLGGAIAGMAQPSGPGMVGQQDAVDQDVDTTNIAQSHGEVQGTEKAMTPGEAPKPKTPFWDTRGGNILGSLIGMLGLGGLGAAIGGISGGGRGAARGASYGMGMGALTDLQSRMAGMSAPANLLEQQLKSQKTEIPSDIRTALIYGQMTPEMKKTYRESKGDIPIGQLMSEFDTWYEGRKKGKTPSGSQPGLEEPFPEQTEENTISVR